MPTVPTVNKEYPSDCNRTRIVLVEPASDEALPPFFDSLREHAVALDGRALAALKHSGPALDLYTWLGHRLCRIRKSTGIRVSWASLNDQFDEEYRNPKDFKKEVRSTLRQVIAVYATARLEEVPSGPVLYPSPPPIPKTQVLVQLPR